MRAVDDRDVPRNVRIGRVLAPPLWSFTALLAYKVAYGGLLAALIGPWMIRPALADGRPDRDL